MSTFIIGIVALWLGKYSFIMVTRGVFEWHKRQASFLFIVISVLSKKEWLNLIYCYFIVVYRRVAN